MYSVTTVLCSVKDITITLDSEKSAVHLIITIVSRVIVDISDYIFQCCCGGNTGYSLLWQAWQQDVL